MPDPPKTFYSPSRILQENCTTRLRAIPLPSCPFPADEYDKSWPPKRRSRDHVKQSPAKVNNLNPNVIHPSSDSTIAACAQKMFDVPRLMQIREDDVSGLFLGVNKPIVTEIKADMIRCHAVR